MADMPAYYQEEARITNGVYVSPGVNWDASRNVLSVPFLPIPRAQAAEGPAPNPAGIATADYVREPAVAERPRELVQAAATATAATDASAAAAAPVPAATLTFAMRKSDGSVQRMLERWGAEAGWKVLWETGLTIPILGDIAIDRPDFLQAADLVIKQVQLSGYHIKATAYSNQVLRIGGN